MALKEKEGVNQLFIERAMKMLRFSLVASLLGLLTVSWMSADTLLRVHVVDKDGNAIEKAEVMVATFKSKRGKKDTTNREGIAEFKKLKDGYYRVWARADEFKPGLFEFLRISGEPEKDLRLELKAGFKGGDLYFESPGVLERSRQLAREGVAAMQAQMFLEAEARFIESLALCPSDPATHQNLALAYTNLSKWELAEKSLSEASDLLFTLGEIGGMDEADIRSQQVELEKLRKEIPVRRLREEADKQLEQGDLAGAIEKLKALVELEPENDENYYYLANTLARAGDTEEAVKAIDLALERNPDEDRYRRFKLSVAKTSKRQAGEQAQAVVEEIQKLQDAHDYEGALERAQKALEELEDEYQAPLLVQIARANRALNRPDEAVGAFKKSLELAPENGEFRKEFSTYLIELERYEEAFSSLQKLAEMNSTAFDQALLEVAKELMGKGKQSQARVAFERVIEVNPDCGEAYYELGVEYYYSDQDKERARAMLERYVEIGKDAELLENAKTLLKVIK